MFVSTQALPQIVREYVQEVVFPKAPTSSIQFGIGFLLPYIDRMVDLKIAQYRPALQALGVIDDHGKVDLELARTSAQQALEKAGGRVEMSGYSADRADLDALFSIAQRHATSE